MDDGSPSAAGASSSPAVSLDPDLRERLRRLQLAEEDRRRSLAARVKKERRVLLPVLALSLLAFPNFRFAKVQGESMSPSFHTGATLVLLKSYREFSPLRVGDVVVIKLKHGRNKGEELVKRIVFLQNAQGNARWPSLLVTGSVPVPSDVWFPQYVSGAETVPPNGIIVMGDNVMNSMDSRDFGPVSDDEIVGKVIHS